MHSVITSILKENHSIGRRRVENTSTRFLARPKTRRVANEKVKSLKGWIEAFDAVQNAADEPTLAAEFFKEETITEKELDAAYEKAMEMTETLEMKICSAWKKTNWAQ